jgi:hypothetical protein
MEVLGGMAYCVQCCVFLLQTAVMGTRCFLYLQSYQLLDFPYTLYCLLTIQNLPHIGLATHVGACPGEKVDILYIQK